MLPPARPGVPDDRLDYILHDAGRTCDRPEQPTRSAARVLAAPSCPDWTRAGRRPAGTATRSRRVAGQLGLRHLHLGIDRHAQGRACSPHGTWRAWSPRPTELRRSRRRRLSMFHSYRLRRLGLRDVGRPAARRPAASSCRRRHLLAARTSLSLLVDERRHRPVADPARLPLDGSASMAPGPRLARLNLRPWSSAARGWTCRSAAVESTCWARRPRLVNMYGTTETTVGRPSTASTAPTCPHAASSRSATRSPTPASTSSTRTVNLVPVGVPGEIHVGGPGRRARLPEPARADRRALRRPTRSARPGARLYRTGDLARCRPDGSLEFLGRDRPPGEDPRLPHRARRDRGRAPVAPRRPRGRRGRPRGRGERRSSPTWSAGERARRPSALRALLARALPEYMVPAAFVALSALPLTPNGKIDRRALPAPDAERAAPGVGDLAPRTRPRRGSPRSGARCSEPEQVGVEDGFFDLGGDSILAVRPGRRAARGRLRPSPCGESSSGAPSPG